jgi:LPXTG-motif cell wall-anchored protein
VNAQCTSTGNAIISITFGNRTDLEGQVGTLVMQTSVGQTFSVSLTFLSGATVTVPYPAGIQSTLFLTYTLGAETATATVTFPAGCAPTTTTTTPGATTTAPATTTTTAPPAVTTTTRPPTPNTFAATTTPTTTQVPVTAPGALPKTGSNSTVPLLAVASGLILAGGIILAARRRA